MHVLVCSPAVERLHCCTCLTRNNASFKMKSRTARGEAVVCQGLPLQRTKCTNLEDTAQVFDNNDLVLRPGLQHKGMPLLWNEVNRMVSTKRKQRVAVRRKRRSSGSVAIPAGVSLSQVECLPLIIPSMALSRDCPHPRQSNKTIADYAALPVRWTVQCPFGTKGVTSWLWERCFQTSHKPHTTPNTCQDDSPSFFSVCTTAAELWHVTARALRACKTKERPWEQCTPTRYPRHSPTTSRVSASLLFSLR